MVMTRGSFPQSLKANVRIWFNEIQKKPKYIWTKFYRTLTSNSAWETMVNNNGFGPMVESTSEIGSVHYDNAVQGFTQNLVIMDLNLGFMISHNAIADDKSNRLLRTLTEALSTSCAETPEICAFSPFNLGFSTDKTYADGKSWFATDHPVVGGGGATYQNRPTIDVDFSETAIEDALITQAQWTDGSGMHDNVKSKYLLVGVDNMFEVSRVFDSKLRSHTANNDIVALNELGELPGGYDHSVYLSDTDSWYIINDVQEGLTFFDRESLNFGQEKDFDSRVHKFAAWMRGVWGFGTPKCAFACPGQ